jgi:sugar transferase (PEP-CTERM/EpsH1 system associated)
MKILYLAHRVPFPPNKGDKIRSFHEIKHFSRAHELHLICFYDSPEDAKHEKALREFCRSIRLIPLRRGPQYLRAGLSMLLREPWTVGFYRNRSMDRAVASALQSARYDLLFVFSSSMAPYVAGLDGTPKILDFVDSDACKWKQFARVKSRPARWLYGYEASHLTRFEVDLVRSFDYSVFVSRREAGHLQAADLREKVHFVQNGIDLDYFRSDRAAQSLPNIIFVGAMDYFPNIDAATYFAREVLPIVRRSNGDARFLIVGSHPGHEVRRLADLPGVTVTGTVDDVRSFLAQARVAVVPIRISQGIQNKILEALAAGLPVVTTPSAASGLTTQEELPLAVAKSPEEFARSVIEFLSRPGLPRDQVAACRRQLGLHYDWNVNLAAFDHLFERAVYRDRKVVPVPHGKTAQTGWHLR